VFLQVKAKTSGATICRFSSPFGDNWPFGDDLFERFGEDFNGIPPLPKPEALRGECRTIGQGSGFVFATKDGLLTDKTQILTNNHMVENEETIHVKLHDGRQFDAAIKGRDPHSDVAVIETSWRGAGAQGGDSSRLEVGEWVVAIGNLFGLSHTLTVANTVKLTVFKVWESGPRGGPHHHT